MKQTTGLFDCTPERILCQCESLPVFEGVREVSQVTTSNNFETIADIKGKPHSSRICNNLTPLVASTSSCEF